MLRLSPLLLTLIVTRTTADTSRHGVSVENEDTIGVSSTAWVNYGCRKGTGWAETLAFCNASLDIETRLDHLIATMTTQEKATQLQVS